MGQTNSVELPASGSDPEQNISKVNNSSDISLNNTLTERPESLPTSSHCEGESSCNNVGNTVVTQPIQPCPLDPSSRPATPMLRDRRNLAVSVTSQTCCGSSTVGHGRNCGQSAVYGRKGLPSSVAIYGTTGAPDTSTVVVTPPTCLPPSTNTPTFVPVAAATPSPPGAAAAPVASSSSTTGCGHWCAACRVRVQVEVECVSNEQRTSFVQRRGARNLSKRVRHKMKNCNKDTMGIPKKKRSPWTLRLNFRSNKGESDLDSTSSASSSSFHTCPCAASTTNFDGCGTCVCPSYRQPESDHHTHEHHHIHHLHPSTMATVNVRTPVIDLARFNPEAYPINDLEEVARQERAREMAEGVEPPPGFISLTGDAQGHQLPIPFNSMIDLQLLFERTLRLGLGRPRSVVTSLTEESLLQQVGRLTSDGTVIRRPVHTQVDYIHCLVPDLLNITNCTFYWGKMDRYEAERLLEKKPEGTFLLRDSAQEEYLFSVSFRRYGRSLHARIEQWDYKFSFDSHDPGVFASDTVCGLIEHYKDPSRCMFFEPMLTNPLARTFPFPLQHLCRAAICNTTTYDGINYLMLPKALQNYLKEYHYKQRVRVRRLDY